jgi:hypothetical protein
MKMVAAKDAFASTVSARRVEEFQQMCEEHAERAAELVVVRAQERLYKRKKEYVRRLKVVEEARLREIDDAARAEKDAQQVHPPHMLRRRTSCIVHHASQASYIMHRSIMRRTFLMRHVCHAGEGGRGDAAARGRGAGEARGFAGRRAGRRRRGRPLRASPRRRRPW